MADKQETDKIYRGPMKIIAFTNNDHYDPDIVGSYWFDGSDVDMQEAEGDHFRPVTFALTESGMGRQYALGMHEIEAQYLMSSLEQLEGELYTDHKGRPWFCVCNGQEGRDLSEALQQFIEKTEDFSSDEKREVIELLNQLKVKEEVVSEKQQKWLVGNIKKLGGKAWEIAQPVLRDVITSTIKKEYGL